MNAMTARANFSLVQRSRTRTTTHNNINSKPVPAVSVTYSACACGGGCSRCQSGRPIQAKLRVGAANDVYEREADRVANAVVQGGVLAPSLSATSSALQRLASYESPGEENAERGNAQTVVDETTTEEEAAAPIQRLKLAQTTTSTPTQVSMADLNASGGNNLPAPIADTMGVRMGADFSGVKIHTDAHAARLAQNLSARAFATGSHIYFDEREYQPQTQEGMQVLAHELTHTVQQGAVPRHAGTSAVESSSAPAVQRMSVLNSSSRSNVLATNVHPWPGRAPVGNDYRVQTDAGNDVSAWVAYSGVSTDGQYWCHGFSLGTYGRWSYSVYSGTGMARVVADEYRPVSAASASSGDLAVWTAMPDGSSYGHSAKFTSPVVSGSALNEASSRLDSKNGMNALANLSLADIVSTYGPGYGVYRHK